jgi:HPt (histidine-containing phosphotransfer) domain-containing protein
MVRGPKTAATGEQMKKFVVHVDPDLSDLMPGFLANKREDTHKIATAAGISDYEGLKALGHRIKGEGGGYGLDSISDIGAELERAANDNDLAAIHRCAEELSVYLDSIEIIFD